MPGYEFRITLNSNTVTCEFDTPKAQRQNSAENTIQRDQHLDTIVVLEQWLRRYEWIAKANKSGKTLLVPGTFKVLGYHLWHLALDNDIGLELIKARDEVAKQDEESRMPIRVRISFEQDASDLAALPWEFVCWPDRREATSFLAAQTNLMLGRFLGDLGDLQIRVSDLKVRVLFVQIFPNTQEFFEQRREIKVLFDALSEIDALEIVPIDGWNPAEVTKQLAEFRTGGKTVDVVHLVAVCEETEGGPTLFLPGDSRDSEWSGQDPQPVVEALTEGAFTRPELAVLHLSDRTGANPPAHFERLAPSFVKAGIPAVLAMQYPMTDPHGLNFVSEFYSQLAKGEAIGAAVQAARRTITVGRQMNRHFGAPVLYMQSPADGRLLRTHPAPDPAGQEIPASGSASADPGLRPPPPNRSVGIAQTLLDEVTLNSPDPSTENVLRDWITSVSWPDDLNTVWRALQAQLRLIQDDRAQADMYRLLMRKVFAMITERDGR